MSLYEIPFVILIFALGASFASFLTASAYRYYNEYPLLDFIKKPSHCDHCKETLKSRDLIPIFSYIANHGKCRNCGKPILFLYPVCELVLGLTFVLLFIFRFPIEYYFLACGLYLFAQFDLLFGEIPSNLMHFGLILSALYFLNNKVFLFGSIRYVDPALVAVSSPATLTTPLFEAFLLCLLFSIANVFKPSFGLADILLFFTLSFWVGPSQVTKIFFLSATIAGILATPFLLLKRMKRGQYVPFVPFIFLGTIIVLLFNL